MSCTDFGPEDNPFYIIADAQSHFALDTIACDKSNKIPYWDKSDTFGEMIGGPCYFISTDCSINVTLLAAESANPDFLLDVSKYLNSALADYIKKEGPDFEGIGIGFGVIAGLCLLICIACAIKDYCCTRQQQPAQPAVAFQQHANEAEHPGLPLLNTDNGPNYGGVHGG